MLVKVPLLAKFEYFRLDSDSFEVQAAISSDLLLPNSLALLAFIQTR